MSVLDIYVLTGFSVVLILLLYYSILNIKSKIRIKNYFFDRTIYHVLEVHNSTKDFKLITDLVNCYLKEHPKDKNRISESLKLKGVFLDLKC